MGSQHTHVHHLSPALVVAVRSGMILAIVRALNVELGVVGMVGKHLDLTLHRSVVLSMNLIGERPESTFPNEASLGIPKPNVVFVVHPL